MSDSNIVRNTSASSVAFTCNGSDYILPGNGDTTMLPREVALYAERNHFHDGVQIVHPEAEAEERAKAQSLVAELKAAVAPPVVPEEPRVTKAELFAATDGEKPVKVSDVIVRRPRPEPPAREKKPYKGKR